MNQHDKKKTQIIFNMQVFSHCVLIIFYAINRFFLLLCFTRLEVVWIFLEVSCVVNPTKILQ